MLSVLLRNKTRFSSHSYLPPLPAQSEQRLSGWYRPSSTSRVINDE